MIFAGHVKPVLEYFGVCDLLRIFNPADELSIWKLYFLGGVQPTTTKSDLGPLATNFTVSGIQCPSTCISYLNWCFFVGMPAEKESKH